MIVECEKVRETCFIKKKDLRDDRELVFTSSGKCNKGTKMIFSSCLMYQMPNSSSILNHMPNITSLSIEHSGISKIFSEDFVGLSSLKLLNLKNNCIEYLPGDLFEHTPNLEHVWFSDNKIKYIDVEIFDSVPKLHAFFILRNTNIDAYYLKAWHALGSLKKKILNDCSYHRLSFR